MKAYIIPEMIFIEFNINENILSISNQLETPTIKPGEMTKKECGEWGNLWQN